METTAQTVFRFASFPGRGLLHGITGRTAAMPLDGDVSYVTGDDAASVANNRVRWSALIGVDPHRWVCAQQVHGTHAVAVTAAHAGRGSDRFDSALPGTDIILTDTPNLPIAIFCADCTPVLLLDPVRRAVAVAHAGWRGTVNDVAGATVRALVATFGTNPADVVAGIGPAIGPCCYDVGQEVIDAWEQTGIGSDGVAVIRRPDVRRLDLWEANRRCLIGAGVPPERIEIAGICTRCRADEYFSHRSRVQPEGRFAAVVALDGGPLDG